MFEDVLAQDQGHAVRLEMERLGIYIMRQELDGRPLLPVCRAVPDIQAIRLVESGLNQVLHMAGLSASILDPGTGRHLRHQWRNLGLGRRKPVVGEVLLPVRDAILVSATLSSFELHHLLGELSPLLCFASGVANSHTAKAQISRTLIAMLRLKTLNCRPLGREACPT
jgi:hypothetical protein